jgi:hypothetical protein
MHQNKHNKNILERRDIHEYIHRSLRWWDELERLRLVELKWASSIARRMPLGAH